MMSTKFFLLCVVVLCGSVAAQRNLLRDPSFEGDLLDWEYLGAARGAAAGVVGGRHGDRAYQVLRGGVVRSGLARVGAGVALTASAYVRTANARQVQIAVRAFDRSGRPLGEDLGYAGRVPAQQLAWARIRSIVRTPEGCVGVRVLLRSDSGTVVWDAVQLEFGREPTRFTAGCKNLLSNSGMADGELHWAVQRAPDSSATGQVVAGAGRDGSSAWHVVAADPRDAVAVHSGWVRCRPNTRYVLSTLARVTGARRAWITVWVADGRGRVIRRGRQRRYLESDAESWQRVSMSFLTPPAAARLRAQLVCEGGEAWWDDVQLERGGTATAYLATPAAVVLPDCTPQAVAYAGAIVREARLRDVLGQTRRLYRYAGRPAAQRAGVVAVGERVAELAASLEATALVPAFQTIDYPAFAVACTEIETQLAALWRGYGAEPAGLFEPWAPPPLGDRGVLTDEFVVFPNVMRTAWFAGRPRWAILAPLGFRMVGFWAGIPLSPRGGVDATALQRIVRRCAEHGYRCDVAVDGGVMAASSLRPQLGSEVYLHTADGRWSDVGHSHNTVNIWHPKVREVAFDYLEAVAKFGATQPNIVAWELCNEPSLAIEAHTGGYGYRPIGVGGYSPQAVRAWQAWLAQSHGEITRLNAAWRTDHQSWDQIEPPRGPLPAPRDGRTAVSTGAIYDFQSFRADSHAHWFAACSAALRRAAVHKPVISQLFADHLDRKSAAIDLLRMAEDGGWDVLGTHDWPGGLPAVSSLHVVSMNQRARLPQWSDELAWSQWARKGTSEAVMRPVLERNLWRQVAWGKRGILLFNLTTEWKHDGPENWNNSLLNVEADLAVPRYCTGVIPTVERKVARIKEVLFGTTVAFDEVAILRPTASWLVASPERATRTEFAAVARYLLGRHVVPRVVPEEHLADSFVSLRRFQLVVAPWAVHLPVVAQQRLLAWVRGGGTLLAIGPVGLFDENGEPSAALLGAVWPDARWRYQSEGGKWHADGLGETERYGGTDVVRTRLGKGEIVLCCDRVGEAGTAPLLERVLGDALDALPIVTGLKNIEIVPRHDVDGNRYLFVVNLATTFRRSGPISLRGQFVHAVDLTCAARPAVPVTRRGSRTEIVVDLDPGAAAFLQLR